MLKNTFALFIFLLPLSALAGAPSAEQAVRDAFRDASVRADAYESKPKQEDDVDEATVDVTPRELTEIYLNALQQKIVRASANDAAFVNSFLAYANDPSIKGRPLARLLFLRHCGAMRGVR